MSWLVLKNSLLVSGATLLLATSFGLLAALWTMGLGRHRRMFMLGVAIVTFALPPFLVTNCWLDLLGDTGAWRMRIPLNIYSTAGTVWILSLLLWPVTFFAALSAWGRLQPSQLDSDPALTGWKLIRAILVPMGGASIIQGAVLTLVLALNNFTVPAILQVKVISADIWVRYSANLSSGSMLLRSWPMVLIPLLLLICFFRADFTWPQLEGPVGPSHFRQQLGRIWFSTGAIVTVCICLLSTGLPLFQLISLKRTWTELPGALVANSTALWNSLWYAVAAAAALTGLGLIRTMWRSPALRGRFAANTRIGSCEILLWLPLLVPGIVLGLLLIYVFNRPPFWFIYRSSWVVIFAFIIRYVALGWNTAAQASRGIDPDLIDDARLNGANAWQTLRFVQWPQIAPQLTAAAYVIFLLCLWDVESMVLVWPPGGETLALSVFNLLHYGHNAQVNALCLTLLMLAVTPLLAWRVSGLFHARWMSMSRPVIPSAFIVFLVAGCSVQKSGNEVSLSGSHIFSSVQVIGRRGVGVGELNKPRSVAVDSEDSLYVVDMTGRVQKFSADGVFSISWQLPQTDLGKPKGMTRDRNGNIVVIEPHYQRINHFTMDGTLAGQWGVKGTNAGQFTLPRAVAVNSYGEIYVSEYGAAERVQRFRISEQSTASTQHPTPLAGEVKGTNTVSAAFMDGFGVAGTAPGYFNRPEGLCVDAKDQVYVADSCNHRIQVFSREGKLIRVYGKAGKQKGELSYPYDICVDGAGRQYVCEFGNSRIQVFDANDRSIDIIGGPGSEPGQFSNPWGVALDSAGNLYVADSQNHRVQKLIRDENVRQRSETSANQLTGWKHKKRFADGLFKVVKFQFTHDVYLLLLIPALAWVVWFAWKSDVQLSKGRRSAAFGVRVMVLVALVFALAGLQWLRPMEGMNVFFALDRSDSVPSGQQDAARIYINKASKEKKKIDKAGVIVFGTEASIETSPSAAVDIQKIQAVVNTERTDLAAAVRLATAAFPETGQKRLVVLSDGNENIGDAMGAVLAARNLGVTVDVWPLGVTRANDLSVQKVQIPSRLKIGQAFDVKIFVQADQAQTATVRLYRNEQFLGEQPVELSAGKNLFSFPQTLPEQGFYSYDVRVDAPGDPLPQNNRASGFATVRGEPRVLIVSSDREQDQQLVASLQTARLDVRHVEINDFPATLAEMQSYDAIFISNIAAGDLGSERHKLLESAVRDFGVGLVCVGGDQTYAAGGYRGTALETTLPVSMELDSKKVLPSGAVVLIMHGMEFGNGQQISRDCAQGVLAALGPADEMGLLLWDGSERWLFELQKVGNKKALQAQIAGMNQGDLGSFQNIMEMAQGALKKSTSNLKHIIVFSDGDPGAPSQQLMQSIVGDRITVSTILIAGHVGPDTMMWIAGQGKGEFYNVTSPSDLPQVFIKETAVILKSAIYEEPFKPQLRGMSEVVRGISPSDYPTLLGYVATTPKARAETPLWTDKGDPLLAHWQYGLGRAVAFTSDAKSRWARLWLNWDKYRQFWSQIGQWSLRRVENADFTTEVTVDKGEALIHVDTVDAQGDYQNFLNLETIVVSPKGERQTIRLNQTGPGHYEARFPTKEVGAYLLNLMDIKEGQVRGSQVVGASVNYSPEFIAPEPNFNLLQRLADSGGGKVLDPAQPDLNPFLHNRLKTYQPRDLWEWLLKAAIILFTLDVAVRRIQIDREEWLKATQTLRRWIFFWNVPARPAEADVSLAALLARRETIRSKQTAPAIDPKPDLFRPKTTPSMSLPGQDAEPATVHSPAAAVVAESPKPDEQPAQSTTSRLLDAKRRAQKRKS